MWRGNIMTEHKFLYRDSGGVRRTLVTDTERPGQFQVFTEADMEAVLREVAQDRDAIRPRSTNKVVAKVPMTIYEQSIHEQWDEGDWKRWLNDPDNSAFRVWPGRV